MSPSTENGTPRAEIAKSIQRIMKSHPLHFHALSILFLLPIVFTLLVYPSFHLAFFHPDYNLTQIQSLRLPLSNSEIVVPIVCTLFLSLFYLSAVATITHSAVQALCERPINLLSSIKSIRNSFFPLLSTFILSHTILISMPLIFAVIFAYGLIELKYDLNHFLIWGFYLLIVLVPILVWLQVNWLLAYVIAVVEFKSGFEALRRSANLLKGKRWIALHKILFYGLSMGMLVVCHSIFLVVVGVADANLVVVFVIVQCLVVGFLLMNYYLLENVALYMYCKDEFFNGEKSPLEIGDKFSGASKLVFMPMDDEKNHVTV